MNPGAPFEGLKGRLLVAGPMLLDPNFRRTVILLGEHGEEGAMGVVLDRPTDVTVADGVPPLAALAGPDALVHIGGPVQPEAVVVLAEFAEPGRARTLVTGAVGFLPGELDDPDELGELARVRVFAGYAGWAAGQLERELEENAWIVVRARPDDVFSSGPERLRHDVLRREGGAYAVLALLPDDPRVN